LVLAKVDLTQWLKNVDRSAVEHAPGFKPMSHLGATMDIGHNSPRRYCQLATLFSKLATTAD